MCQPLLVRFGSSLEGGDGKAVMEELLFHSHLRVYCIESTARDSLRWISLIDIYHFAGSHIDTISLSALISVYFSCWCVSPVVPVFLCVPLLPRWYFFFLLSVVSGHIIIGTLIFSLLLTLALTLLFCGSLTVALASPETL